MTREHAVTWAPPTAPAPGLSGLQQVQAAADGALPLPPYAALIGQSTSHVEPGLVRMALTPAEFHYNPMNTVHGGVIVTLLESALAAAIRTTLPAGQTCLTLEIKVSYARAITTATGPITAEGRVVHAGRQVGLAEGRLVDAAGRLYATATSTCLVMDAPAATGTGAGGHRVVHWDDPATARTGWLGRPGLDAIRHPSFKPPILALLGAEMALTESGRVAMDLDPGEHLFNQYGAVHGGMTATLLDSVVGCAVLSTLPAGRAFTTLELKTSFLRAMTAASGRLRATGQVQHPGRRVVTAEAQMVDAQGRLCATATTTCLTFDARPG